MTALTDQDRIEMSADNCEALRSRLEKYEDADGNPISTISEQAREIASLRSIISECAAACGAVVSVQCSEGFMAMLPDEIRSAMSGKSREIASKQATIDGMNEAHRKVAQELAALKAQPSGVVLPELRTVVTDAFMGMIAAVTSTTPPADQPPPPFIQSAIDRAVDRIARLNSSPVSACEPCTCGGNPHTTECLYEHFLSYSGLIDHPLLRYAYFHGAGSGCDKPAASAGGVDERASIQSDISCDSAYRNGLIAGFNFGINEDEAGYQRSLTCYQGGINEARAALTANVRCQVCADTGRVHEPGQPEGDCRACVEAGRVSSAGAPNHSEQAWNGGVLSGLISAQKALYPALDGSCERTLDGLIKAAQAAAALSAPSQGGEAVAGTLHISHFRDNPAMENVDFQLIADLKPGSYRLYTHPAGQVAEPHAELVELLKGLVEIVGRKNRGRSGSPNHSHSIPGIWDSDNGDLAGKPCAECALYNLAVARIAALQP